MIRFFSKAVFSAFCLCSLFTGCKKEEIGALASNEKVSLRISVPIDETKVTSGMDETAVWNYQVFLFDAEGDIEDYVSQSSDDIRLDCTLGRKSIVVCVNALFCVVFCRQAVLFSRCGKFKKQIFKPFLKRRRLYFF